jgi:hypothetical protein
MVWRREEISCVVGATVEGVFETMVGMAGVASRCGIL